MLCHHTSVSDKPYDVCFVDNFCLKYFVHEIALVPSQKTQKIDLNTEYPCPCRRRGALVPITLTEAFGCNRCQQIFVVEESGYVIEQLSTSYPYKKAWRWTGHRWSTANSSLGERYLPIALGIVFVLLIFGLSLVHYCSPSSSSSCPIDSNYIILGALLLAVLLALLPALMVWLTYRR